jgi:hypothetical protein
MSQYFSKFPIITYGKQQVRDITKRFGFINDLKRDPYLFLPYTIKEKQKPEDIAYYYYGSVDDTWIVLLCNNITDPYTQWPLDEDLFNKYFISKYSEFSGKKGTDVLVWGQNTSIYDNIVYYYKENEVTKIISRLSPESVDTEYDLDLNDDFILDELTGRKRILSQTPPVGYFPIRIYEYEYQLNENRREILLVDRKYKSLIKEEFYSK